MWLKVESHMMDSTDFLIFLLQTCGFASKQLSKQLFNGTPWNLMQTFMFDPDRRSVKALWDR